MTTATATAQDPRAAAYGVFARQRLTAQRTSGSRRFALHNFVKRLRALKHKQALREDAAKRGDDGSGVTAYRHVDDNGRVYYVGVSGPRNRLAQAAAQGMRLKIPKVDPYRVRSYTPPGERKDRPCSATATENGIEAALEAERPRSQRSSVRWDGDKLFVEWKVSGYRYDQREARRVRMARKQRRGWA